MSEVVISDLYLNCEFIPLYKEDMMDSMFGHDQQKENFTTNHLNLKLKPRETKEVMLEVIPHRPGEIFIKGFIWELFDIV